jgi:hypothetical protein
MSKVMFDYTKSILEELVLILLFCKELEKSNKCIVTWDGTIKRMVI